MGYIVMQGHIYLVTNTINNKQYIGQTIDTKRKIGHGIAINHAYKQYGKNNFTYKIIVSGIDNKNTLNYLERFWIKTFNTQTPNGYNIEAGGSGHNDHNKGLPPWNKGIKTPAEVRLKQSIAKKGKPSSRKGKINSEEHRLKISLSKKGKRQSDEVYKKQGLAKMGKKQKLIECPHCHKIGGNATMPRWHFDNCKEKV
jgi:group I intron endonuclease